jgi:hypothetical protein
MAVTTAEFVEQARTRTRAEFVAQHPGHFLVKRPRKGVSLESEPPQFGFATTVTKINIDPLAGHWQVFPIAKRPGNPFPERMTVGRATNCDIVLRVPFISKVHAHILRDGDGNYSVQDNESAQSTFHNHRKLAPGVTRRLEIEDQVSFGSLQFEFVDAARLYDVLKAEAR